MMLFAELAEIVIFSGESFDERFRVGHADLLPAPGPVEVDTADGETFSVSVDEGILSVANNRVSVLASHAELSGEIDLATARSELETARADAKTSQAEIHRLEARVRAAERVS